MTCQKYSVDSHKHISEFDSGTKERNGMKTPKVILYAQTLLLRDEVFQFLAHLSL
jgi:hypothetical protein